jgi:hypothetical protein
MKKQLNVDVIQSELRGGSAFFPNYNRSGSPIPAIDTPEPKPATQPNNKPGAQSEQGVPPPVPRPGPRTVPRPDNLIPKTRRPIRQRQPFDIYEDQYARLKKIAESERDFINGRGMEDGARGY